MTRILGISGSLRRDSHNTSLLRAAAEAAGPDVELELYDGLKVVPPYDEDDDVHPRPTSVARLNAAIANADAVLFATPEYNASIPGHLKNAVDWNNPLPSGQASLANDVTILAELQFVRPGGVTSS